MNTIKNWLFLAIFLGQSLGHASPLHEAARAGDLDEVKRLLDSGEANIEDKGDLDKTAIMCAAYHGHAEMVRVLLIRGANFLAVDCFDQSALSLAIKYNRPEAGIVILKWSALKQIRASNSDLVLLEQKSPGILPRYNKLFADHGIFLLEEASQLPKEIATIIHGYLGNE